MDRPDFPVSAFYKPHVIDGMTIARGGGWWSAALLIRDPRNRKPFVGLYRWQETRAGWKTRARFKIRSHRHVRQTISILTRFLERMEQPEEQRTTTTGGGKIKRLFRSRRDR